MDPGLNVLKQRHARLHLSWVAKVSPRVLGVSFFLPLFFSI